MIQTQAVCCLLFDQAVFFLLSLLFWEVKFLIHYFNYKVFVLVLNAFSLNLLSILLRDRSVSTGFCYIRIRPNTCLNSVSWTHEQHKIFFFENKTTEQKTCFFFSFSSVSFCFCTAVCLFPFFFNIITSFV